MSYNYVIMVCGSQKVAKSAFENKIFALKHVKLHVWPVCVGTHLKQIILGVPDALGIIFLDLNMKNEPNVI